MVLTVATTRAARGRTGRPGGGPTALLYRNYRHYRRAWLWFVTGFAEPVLYLFSIGVGVGALIPGFTYHGRTIEYAAFVAPAMLATSAMNGALYDSTFQIFHKLKFQKVYDAVLATPMTSTDVARGEVAWATLRSCIYAAFFLTVMLAMGLVGSWWALLALPATVLVGLCFSGVGIALTTFMRSWQDFEYVMLAVVPMFLFSATFFPVERYAGVVRWIVEATPLYRAVVLLRELCTGAVTTASLVSVVYLATLGCIGMWVVSRRLDRLLLR